MAYGKLGLKPNEFWALQPKDIMIMNEGFEEQRQYNEVLHLQTLRLLRVAAHTTYMSIPLKKGHKHEGLLKFYPLPFDPEPKKVTIEEITNFFETKEPIITNGKLRGYKDKNGNVELIN